LIVKKCCYHTVGRIPVIGTILRAATATVLPPERRETDAAAAVNRFLINFEQSYGAVHPPFFQGSYTQVSRNN
jgi:hypothetical protein